MTESEQKGESNIPPPTQSRSAPLDKGELKKSHPTPTLPSEEGRRETVNFNAWQMAWELGYTITIPIVALALVGRWADKEWGTSPWMLLAGIVVSIIISSALVYKRVASVLKSQITNSKSQTISNDQSPNDRNRTV